ncbi:hypothetical protein [Legionella hackeliae]|uniref:Uncharacterized protein n=1 Tax=Legionella hackeliae TaxID=449 RepID=A0A0A8URA0_LEGHA|nr:hypothetical protein [Legionella hackeliae]KTD10528.1 hypothetical protein Lhac_2896 [Legionella hackeliae]CEK10031.1 protein of unknown function [Legionella hackeliae]STX46756.1 Uncharacterised protein [Legionella hackeliae]
MSNLVALLNTVYTNYMRFTETNDSKHLLENIKAFQKISQKDIAKELKEAHISELEECNKTLILVAQSYIEYAFLKKEKLPSSKLDICLNHAQRCYEYVINAARKIPPYNLGAIGPQNTEAIYYTHKIKFLRAKLDLFSINIKMQSTYDAAEVSSALKAVLEACDTFKAEIDRNYRYVSYKEDFGINEALFNSIKQTREEAQSLLSKANDYKKEKRRSETLSSDKSSAHKKTSQRKKAKHAPTEEPKVSQNEVDPSPSSFVPPPNQVIAPTIAITSTTCTSEDWSSLEALMKAASEDTPIPPVQSPKPAYATLSYSSFWAHLDPNQDSKRCLGLMKNWIKAYFPKQRICPSQGGQDARVLEKLAQGLLLAAQQLQQESNIYGQKHSNPALQLAVQLLYRSTELASVNDRQFSEDLTDLSVRYSSILINFIQHTPGRVLSDEDYLQHLHRVLGKTPALIKTSHTPVEEIVKLVFLALEKSCSAQDYNLVKEVVFNAFNQATTELSSNMILS